MLQLVRQPARLLEPLDLSLATRPDQPEAILPERVHANLADDQERARSVRLPGCGLAVHDPETTAKARLRREQRQIALLAATLPAWTYRRA